MQWLWIEEYSQRARLFDKIRRVPDRFEILYTWVRIFLSVCANFWTNVVKSLGSYHPLKCARYIEPNLYLKSILSIITNEDSVQAILLLLIPIYCIIWIFMHLKLKSLISNYTIQYVKHSKFNFGRETLQTLGHKIEKDPFANKKKKFCNWTLNTEYWTLNSITAFH